MAEDGIKKVHILSVQLLLVCLTIYLSGFQSLSLENWNKWVAVIARYTVYLLLIRGSKGACSLLFKILFANAKLQLPALVEDNRKALLVFVIATSVLVYSGQTVLREDFLLLFLAYLITQYPEMEDKLTSASGSTVITYGVGMACSFFEGYLIHVIPSDGGRFVGFEENINVFEAKQGVVFPVKRLFIVITRSLFCPPDLKHFNKPNRPDLPYLEACKPVQCPRCQDFHAAPCNRPQRCVTCGEGHAAEACPRPHAPSCANCSLQHPADDDTCEYYREKMKKSLEDVEKDVAGVKNRTYRNSAYKIYRPGGKPPVFLSAEFATPLHTLHKVLEKRALYEKLCDVNVPEIVREFCAQLETIIARSPDTRGKCELVYFDDKDPEENLADVLLAKIEDIEPDFEEVISRRNNENRPAPHN